jgi:hypothetical protein
MVAAPDGFRVPPPARSPPADDSPAPNESSPVIVLFDEDLDVPAQVSEVPIPVGLGFLPLQRLQKLPQLALSNGLADRLLLRII